MKLITFDPLIDSADIGCEHWNQLIELIIGHDVAGVVVTHGTDTMAFTGAALSFALDGIGIPVVLTGSMKPLGEGLQAEDNLRLAIDAATTGPVGVWLAFDGKLLCGRRLVKHHSQEPDSFRQVADAPPSSRTVVWRRFLPERLSILTLSPGMHASTVEAALSQLDGAVLRVFGSGTLMQEPALQRALLNATDRGCRIIAVSCCEAGGVHQGAYASDGLLWSSGVESGGTATAEAALMRLWLELSERARKQHPETKLVAAI